MILIHGWADFPADAVEAIAKSGEVLQSSSRNEEGCVHYGLAWDVEQPTRITLLEIWADEAAYAGHKEQPYVAEFTELAATNAIEPPTFVRFDAEPTES